MKQWYEELFENNANNYENEFFTKGTIGEVEFIENEIDYNKNYKILDIGCGTGRHSILLAQHGYDVTGIDLSECQLAKAREHAAEKNVNVNFIKQDACDFNFNETYDLAIMLCEGAFSLMETDEKNFQILKNACSSLKNNGKFIFTTLNGLFPIFHDVQDFLNEEAIDNEEVANSYFDLMTLRQYVSLDIVDDNGEKKTLNCNQRHYMPSEINWLLKSIGFSKVDIYGCKLGAYSRNDKLTKEDFEMLVIAEK
jgi:2-polyprenyl-3-methyl-5-hydroxy-6-metoxy-1,4-benzoquinol methylase